MYIMIYCINILFYYLYTGTLYQTTAGVVSYVYMQLRDIFENLISKSGGMVIYPTKDTTTVNSTSEGDSRRAVFHMKVVPVRLNSITFLSNNYAIPSFKNAAANNMTVPMSSVDDGMRFDWDSKMELFESYFYQGLYYEPNPTSIDSSETPSTSNSNSSSDVEGNILQEGDIIDNYDGSYV